MSDEQVSLHFQVIRQQIMALPSVTAETDAALEDLQMIYEQMQTTLDAAGVVEKVLIQQNQQIIEAYEYYYDLFQSLPIAYLVTDAEGVILHANQAIADLLKVPQRYLIGKPLILYIAERDRPDFYLKLTQVSQSSLQAWQTTVCPRDGSSLAVELHVEPVRDVAGAIESLRIGVSAIAQQRVLRWIGAQPPQAIQEESAIAACTRENTSACG